MSYLPPPDRAELYNIIREVDCADPHAKCLLATLDLQPWSDERWTQVFAEIETAYGFNGLRFSQIIESNAMIEEFWCKPQFCFVRTYQGLFNDCPEDWVDLPPTTDVLPADDGMFKWDGVQKPPRGGSTLSDWINSHFGLFGFESHEFLTRVRRTPRAPWVVRLRYSSRNPNLRFYHDLSYFELQIRQDPPQRIAYRCIAAVKLRNGADDYDTIRLFDSDGIWYLPNGEVFPMNERWKVENGGEFMLFYLRTNVHLKDNEGVPWDDLPSLHPMAQQRRRLRGWLAEALRTPSSPPRRQKAHTPDNMSGQGASA